MLHSGFRNCWPSASSRSPPVVNDREITRTIAAAPAPMRPKEMKTSHGSGRTADVEGTSLDRCLARTGHAQAHSMIKRGRRRARRTQRRPRSNPSSRLFEILRRQPLSGSTFTAIDCRKIAVRTPRDAAHAGQKGRFCIRKLVRRFTATFEEFGEPYLTTNACSSWNRRRTEPDLRRDAADRIQQQLTDHER
jgi:hypothetical protein